jgi:hypothetical protein
MLIPIIVGFQLLCVAISATPIDAGVGVKLAKRDQLANTDIWVPITSGGGSLVPAGSALATLGTPENNSPDGTPAPYDILFRSDGTCDTGSKTSNGIKVTTSKFCNQQTAVVYGQAMKVSPDIDCSGLQSCSESHTSSFTTSSSHSINPSVDANLGFQAIKIAAKFSGTISWTDSSTQTNAFSFTPRPGSKGHMLFFPYMVKACGFILQTVTINPIPSWPPIVQTEGYDPMACGYTPLLLPSGQPDGVSLILQLI